MSEAAPRVIDMGTVPSDYFTAHHHSSGMNVFLTDFMLFNEGGMYVFMKTVALLMILCVRVVQRLHARYLYSTGQ